MRSVALFSVVLLLAACGGGGSGSGSGAPAPTPAPTPAPSPTPAPTPLPAPQNVVVFLIDDLAIPDANFMQASFTRRYTPQIDALASQSLVLGNLHTVAPICTPSRYSLLTGNYPSRATNITFANRLATEGAAVPEFNTLITSVETTLPKRLQALGVRTGFTGKDHVAEDVGYNPPRQGARLTDPGVQAQLAQNEQFTAQGMRDIGFDEAYSIYRTNPSEQPVVETRVHNLDWIVGGALKFIDGNADRKFFLVVSLTIPHGPLDPASSWNADPRMTPWGYLAQAPNVMPARSTLTARVKAAGRAGDENYLWLDDSIGAVMNSLKSHGLNDKTAILFLSDHGMGAKGSLYAPGSLTAAFLNYRGITGRTDALISNIDFQPTLLEIFGAAPKGDGVSLMPILSGTASSVRQNVFLELGYARSVIQDGYQYIALRHSDYIRSLAAQRGYPLTEWLTYSGVHPLETSDMGMFPAYLATDQLYAYKTDTKEQVNLAGRLDYAAILSKMQDELQAHVNMTPGKFQVR